MKIDIILDPVFEIVQKYEDKGYDGGSCGVITETWTSDRPYQRELHLRCRRIEMLVIDTISKTLVH